MQKDGGFVTCLLLVICCVNLLHAVHLIVDVLAHTVDVLKQDKLCLCINIARFLSDITNL